MTAATQGLVEELCGIIDENKYLILTGASAVGKSYIAAAVAERCAMPEYHAQGKPPGSVGRYEVITETVSFHPSLSYEDVVAGVAMRTHYVPDPPQLLQGAGASLFGIPGGLSGRPEY